MTQPSGPSARDESKLADKIRELERVVYLRNGEIHRLIEQREALESRCKRLEAALKSISQFNNGIFDGIKLYSAIQIAKKALAALEQEK